MEIKQPSLISLINRLIEKSLSLISYNQAGEAEFIDPNENAQISAHYGLSHCCAALIIFGNHTDNKNLVNKGLELLKTYLQHHEEYRHLPSFHSDFNNFAISLIIDEIEPGSLKEQIKENLLNAADSNHNTVNWLPMRMFANLKRFELSNKSVFKDNVDRNREIVLKAINEDGGIEDRLPKGLSFNLQYDISTLATLHLLQSKGIDFPIEKCMGFLLQCVAPDGDINYQGRGTNQIFAWGPWVYLLSNIKDKSYIESSLEFLESKIDNILKNNSLMLNDYNGKEKFLWWDYHYFSVYIAHLLLWMVLAETSAKQTNQLITPQYLPFSDTGLEIYRDADLFTVIFNGRSEYLSEYGPALSAIYLQDEPLYKGTFGPWRGLFGNVNSIEDNVIKNFCGLIQTNRKKENIVAKVKRKFKIPDQADNGYTIHPIFQRPIIEKATDGLSIVWKNEKRKNVFLNFITMHPSVKLELYIDGVSARFPLSQKIRNQYGWCDVYQSLVSDGQSWKLIIKK